MNSTLKDKSGVELTCTAHCSPQDALYGAGCVAAFLQYAVDGLLNNLQEEGPAPDLIDARYGMEKCFYLMRDLMALATSPASSWEEKGGEHE